MHIRFLIDPARCCLWHGEAIRRVLDAGDDRHGSWRAVTTRRRLSPVLALERLVYGAPADGPLARLDVAALEVEAADGPVDFEIDLAGGDVATGLSLGYVFVVWPVLASAFMRQYYTHSGGPAKETQRDTAARNGVSSRLPQPSHPAPPGPPGPGRRRS